MEKVSLFGVRYIFYSVVWSLVGDLMLALFCRSSNKKAAGIGMLLGGCGMVWREYRLLGLGA